MEFHECDVIGVAEFYKTSGQCQYCRLSLLTEDLENPINPVSVMLNTDPECKVV